MCVTKLRPLCSVVLMKLLCVMSVIAEFTMPISSQANTSVSFFSNQLLKTPLNVISARYHSQILVFAQFLVSTSFNLLSSANHNKSPWENELGVSVVDMIETSIKQPSFDSQIETIYISILMVFCGFETVLLLSFSIQRINKSKSRLWLISCPRYTFVSNISFRKFEPLAYVNNCSQLTSKTCWFSN